jgi:hypothetical protein
MTAENPFAGQGAVMLDIGGDIGAVVVTMPPELDGQEIEIRPVGAVSVPSAHAHAHDHPHTHDHPHSHEHSPWPHVAVLARPTPSGPIHSLVFGEVLAGRYELYVRPDGPVRLSVDVVGGAVTEATWPT